MFERTVRQYFKRNCQYFKKRVLLCVEEYFEQVEGLLRSWRSTLSLFFEIS
jgi:hypothetical protein